MLKLREFLDSKEYYERKLDDCWRAILHNLFPSLEEDVAGCRTRFSTWRCEGVDGHRAHRPVMCRRRSVCYACAKQISEELAEDLVNVVHEFYSKIHARVKFWSVEFTVPRDLWPKVKDVKQFRNLVREVLKSFFGEDGRYELMAELSVHFWHSYHENPKKYREDSNPFAGWYPHVHGIIFNRAYDKHVGRFVEKGFYLRGKDELKNLRAAWRAALVRTYGETEAKDVDIHFWYSVGYGHLRHRGAYMYRSAVVDFYKYAKQDHSLRTFNADWIKEALQRPHKEKRTARFGFFQDAFFYKYMAKIGLDIPRKARRMKEMRRVFCPKCGEEMHILDVPDKSLSDLVYPILSYVDSGGGLVRGWE